MNLNFTNLFELFDIPDRELFELRRKVVESFGNYASLADILAKHCGGNVLIPCLSCENDPYCLALFAGAYLDMGQHDQETFMLGVKTIEQSCHHFRLRNELWNHIISTIILGLALERIGKQHQASKAYQDALRELNKYLPIHLSDYERQSRGQDLIDALEKHKTQTLLPHSSDELQTHIQIENPTATFGDDDYLALFSLPIHGTVTAGPNGLMETQEIVSSFTAVHNIEIGDQKFFIRGVRKTAIKDHQIKLRTGTRYGWALVRGLSMNAWEDYPLDLGDYVLFEPSEVANDNDFVIISSTEPSGERVPIVKRYDAHRCVYCSKSNDKTQEYLDIPQDDDHQIIGIVIAVAKPIKET